MTRMNRIFQEGVFEKLLSFDSDDFRNLVLDLKNESRMIAQRSHLCTVQI